MPEMGVFKGWSLKIKYITDHKAYTLISLIITAIWNDGAFYLAKIRQDPTNCKALC